MISLIALLQQPTIQMDVHLQQVTATKGREQLPSWNRRGGAKRRVGSQIEKLSTLLPTRPCGPPLLFKESA